MLLCIALLGTTFNLRSRKAKAEDLGEFKTYLGYILSPSQRKSLPHDADISLDQKKAHLHTMFIFHIHFIQN